MPDLTSSGAPSQERNERIRRRKVEVNLLRLRAAALDAQCDIEQMETSIEQKHEQIRATEEQIRELEEQLKEAANG
jgi:uncharacterized protein (DUF3084 family)